MDDSNVSALRYVVSLTAVKRQIYMLIAAAGVVGAAIIFFVILSNSYFINSVINPIDEVRKIALADLQGRLFHPPEKDQQTTRSANCATPSTPWPWSCRKTRR